MRPTLLFLTCLCGFTAVALAQERHTNEPAATSTVSGHRARWNNVLAPILLPFVGFPVGPLAYYIVSATSM